MSKEGQFIAYSGEETAALQLWAAERAEWYEHYLALEALVKDDPAAREHWDALEPRFNNIAMQWSHVLHARLVRVMPHLADAITYLIWPEFMRTPEWLDERGTPEPHAYPVSRETPAWWWRAEQARRPAARHAAGDGEA